MKPRHVGMLALVVVVVAIGLLVYRGLGSVNHVIQGAVLRYGPEIAGADVQLSGVDVSLTEGRAELSGLQIGNPRGFSTAYAIRADRVRMVLDLDSLTAEPIVIREIRVDGPSVIYETGSGGDNIDALAKNIRTYLGAGEGKGESRGRKLVIEDLVISGGSVAVSHTALQGKTLTAPLPEIHLQDIGKNRGGASPGEVAREVMDSIRSGAGTAVGSLHLDKLPGGTADAVKQGAGSVMEGAKDAGSFTKDGVSGAGEKLKGIFSDKD